MVILFTGMTPEEAKSKAEGLGLVVEPNEEVYSDVEAGLVCGQSINASTEVPKGTSIRFQVSKGPDPDQPAVTPPPGESTEPQPTPPVESAGPTLNPLDITVPLPNDGRETVQVRITVDDQERFNGTRQTVLGLTTITVYGSGVQNVSVYIDGELQSTTPYDFG